MFWILRRTGAANFFNSLNNNCSSSKSSAAGRREDKYVKRPPRKAYGRLRSSDADDTISLKQTIDESLDDLDNFESNVANKNMRISNQSIKGGAGDEVVPCTVPDCEGNYMTADSNSCDLNMCEPNGATVDFKTNKLTAAQQQKELYENSINRLNSMAMSDDDDYDESLTCNVCDRSFHCHRQLASHQQKKRHFGCTGCDSLFPSLMSLEHHKEEFEHWSDDEMERRICCRRNRDEYFTDTDSYTSEAESEDMERLL